MTKRCAIISFRLGGTDGVAIIAKTWENVLNTLGWETTTIAGASPDAYPLDVELEGLAIDATVPIDEPRLAKALADVDIVLCENILSVPINLAASRTIARLLRGRPAIIHHHDLPWQLEQFRDNDALPVDDPAWRHVTINRMTQRELGARGIESTLIYNGFDTKEPLADRNAARERYRFADDELVVVHPVRAIRRKNIAAATRLAENLDATYWLTGATENGYDDELATILAATSCRIVRQTADSLATMYAASDLVVFPSLWEGFGNPPIEAAIHRRLAAVGTYPVSAELRELGFDWLDPLNPASVSSALTGDTTARLDHNQDLAREHFSLDRLTDQVSSLLAAFN